MPFVIVGESVAFVSRNPVEIMWQDDVLHCESGPSVRFRDGWCVWTIGGHPVDEQIVMRPETQTIDQIKNEENEETKRIRIERYGWPRYLENISATVIDQRQNDVEQTIEALMHGDDMHVLVCACPSTARVYGLEVPTEITTCKNAQQWLRNTNQGFCMGAS